MFYSICGSSVVKVNFISFTYSVQKSNIQNNVSAQIVNLLLGIDSKMPYVYCIPERNFSQISSHYTLLDFYGFTCKRLHYFNLLHDIQIDVVVDYIM